MKKIITLIVICSFFIGGCANKSEDKQGDKDLIVLTNSGYPPYEMVDEKGNLYGFDIDVMNEAAKIAGYNITWQDVDFDAIIDSLNTEKGDVAIAGISPTPERLKQVDFSEIYYASSEMTNVVLVKKDSLLKTMKDLHTTKIGIQMGTIQETIVESIQEEYNLEFEKLKTYVDLAQELNNGIIDAMVVEQSTADELMKNNDKFRYFKLEAGENLSGNAMTFKKNSPLKKDFDQAINEMKKNGKLDELIKKWFK